METPLTENHPHPMITTENENHTHPIIATESEKIIELLQQQNTYLKALYEFELKKQKAEKVKTLYHITISLLPSLLALAIIYFIYTTLTTYIESLNNNVNALRSGFDSIVTMIQKFIPDFSAIKDSLKNTWQNINFLH